MLISHHHRFVFVKPRKTAGTSVELALSPFLAPGDLATPIEPEEEPLRKAAAGVIVGQVRARGVRLRDHSPLEKCWRALPQVQGYRVVTMCRNPWDRAVSQFFWSMRRTSIREAAFDAQRAGFIAYTRRWGPRTWLDAVYGRKRQRALDSAHLYVIGGQVRADYVIRFEALAADLAGLGEWLGLGGVPVLGVAAKSGLRAGGGAWVPFFDDATRELVARECAREIDLFGYDFEGRAVPRGPLLA